MTNPGLSNYTRARIPSRSQHVTLDRAWHSNNRKKLLTKEKEKEKEKEKVASSPSSPHRLLILLPSSFVDAMISAPASQALLARTALRSIRTTASHTRLASVILVTASNHGIRSFSASVLHRQAAVVDTPSSSSPSSSSSTTTTTTTTPDSAADIDDAPIETTKTDFPVTTMGRKKRNKRTITAHDKARFLSKWGWFEPDTPPAKRLSSLIGS